MQCCDKARAAKQLGLGVGAAAACAGVMAYAVRSPRSDLFGPSVWHGPRDLRAVALTFDDGPSESTPEILAELERYRARATFFQCGLNIRRLQSARPPGQKGNPFPPTFHADEVEVAPLQGANQFVFLVGQNA